jgi:DNA-binding CsgD family transcriptional regulator
MTNMNDMAYMANWQNTQEKLPDLLLFQHQTQPTLLQDVIDDLMNGILILTSQGELIYANHYARRILPKLSQSASYSPLVPKEIWHICEFLIQSRHLFPNQHWTFESEIFIDDSTTLRIRVRWLNSRNTEAPCLLLTIEDRDQAINDIAMEKAEKYGLTAREKEVWLLRQANYTYKQISSELGITLHTVKKHMKSIRDKQHAIS